MKKKMYLYESGCAIRGIRLYPVSAGMVSQLFLTGRKIKEGQKEDLSAPQ
jgi:hypothetical protein